MTPAVLRAPSRFEVARSLRPATSTRWGWCTSTSSSRGVLPSRIRGDFSYKLASQIVERVSRAARAKPQREDSRFRRSSGDARGSAGLPARRPRQHHSDGAREESSPPVFLRREARRRYSPASRRVSVAARSAGYLYQIGKFGGRHKAVLATASLVALTLIGGIVTTMRQAEIAWDERQRAQRHFDEVRKLANVFMFDVHGAIQDLPGSTPARKMLVENSLRVPGGTLERIRQ